MTASSSMPVGARLPAGPTAVVDAPLAGGLVTARLCCDAPQGIVETIVGELTPRTLREVRRRALTLHAAARGTLTIELRFVDDSRAARLVASLADLGTHGIDIVTDGLAAPAHAAGADPFGLDPAFRAACLPPMRWLFERYWRTEVSGIEHVPRAGGALIAANHGGAVPADAFMLAAALALRHPERRPLRVLYDKFVDALPWLGPLYARLGGVSASFANASTLLRRGELVGLFPEGIAGVEKRWTERYRLRPFKTGTARLSLRTGRPIVPVAIVGAEDAYPTLFRLYRAGRLVGVPWIPVTPLFPLCGLAGAVPLPSKWHIRFCEPIAPPPPNGRSEEERVGALGQAVREAIERALGQLGAARSGAPGRSAQ